MLVPEGTGVRNGVGALEAGLGIQSGAIEYTMRRANDAGGMVSNYLKHGHLNTTYEFASSVSGDGSSQM